MLKVRKHNWLSGCDASGWLVGWLTLKFGKHKEEMFSGYDAGYLNFSKTAQYQKITGVFLGVLHKENFSNVENFTNVENISC